MSDHLHILVVGASGRFAAASALAAGHAVSVVDLFGDLDTRQICEQSSELLPNSENRVLSKAMKIESLRSLTRGSQVLNAEAQKRFHEIEALNADTVIFTGGAENYPEFFSSQFLPKANIAGPAADSIARLLSSAAIQQVCIDHDIRRPRSICYLDQMNKIENTNTVWLKKQVRSGGGLQTYRWDGVAEIDFGSGGYLQEFIKGDTISGCYIATNGDGPTETSFLGACKQHQNPCQNDFRYHGSVGPIRLSKDECREMARGGQCIAEEFQLAGVFGIDFVRGDQGLYLVDINPRIPASAELIERSRRVDESTFTIVEAQLDACVLNQLPARVEISNQNQYSKTIIYLPAERRLNVEAGSIKYFQSRSYFSDVPDLASKIEPHHPLVTVHAKANETKSLKEKSEKRISDLWQFLKARL